MMTGPHSLERSHPKCLQTPGQSTRYAPVAVGSVGGLFNMLLHDSPSLLGWVEYPHCGGTHTSLTHSLVEQSSTHPSSTVSILSREARWVVYHRLYLRADHSLTFL